MWYSEKLLQILYRSVQTEDNLGRHNVGTRVVGNDFYKYVEQFELAEKQVLNGSEVLDSIRSFIPYLPKDPTMSNEMVPIETRKGLTVYAYEIKNQKMETLDTLVAEEVKKLIPLEYDVDFINALKNFDDSYYVFPRNFNNFYLKKLPDLYTTKELDTKLKTKNDEYILVSVDFEKIINMYKNSHNELEEFGTFENQTVYELTSGDMSIISLFMDEIQPENVEDLKYYSEYKPERLQNLYYKPYILTGTKIILVDKMYILSLGIECSYQYDGEDDLEFGEWEVHKVPESYDGVELELKKADKYIKVLLRTGYMEAKTSRYNSIEKIDPKRKFFVKKEYSKFISNFRRSIEETSKAYTHRSYKDYLYGHWFSELSKLNDDWEEKTKKIVQTILMGRFAFLAACLIHSDYRSFDFKLENWGYLPLEGATTVYIPLNKNPDSDRLEVYVGEKYGISLIDHEYTFRNDPDDLRLLMKNSIDIYTDGDSYMGDLKQEDETLYVDPFLLGHRFHSHPQYPYKIKLKQLPKYITEEVRERGGGKEYIETYVGPKNIADALKQRHKDLQNLFT